MADYRHWAGAQVPRRGGVLSPRIAALLLRLLGWRLVGRLPDLPKVLVVAAPHTSNYDGVVALPSVLALDLKIGMMAKHSLFRWPFAGLMRWLGLLPIERHAAGGAVGAAVRAFAETPRLWLGIAPEGTRHGAEQWKTGFHRIALAAGVPILPVAWDYQRRCIALGEPFMPEADVQADLARLYAFYRDKTPRHPERLSGPLRRLKHDANRPPR